MIRFQTSLIALTLLFSLNGHADSSSLMTFDVSGRNGGDASNGSNGSSGYSGGNGSNGGNAGEASSGQSAGRVSLKLNESTKGVLVLSGEVVPAGGGSKTVGEQIQFGTKGYIYLQARGGKGGDGGRGGDGGDGGRGSDGSDATQYSSGTNGGNGGNGGDAGRGSAGKDGGAGGTIVVELPQAQTKLLMLVEHAEGGGRGGGAGAHGRPGSGGSGGRGGSSYSWTETTYSTDSDGNQTSSSTSHSNSGGMSGSSGYSGSSASGDTSGGRNGANGSFTIRVVDERGNVAEYQSRYDLTLEGYDLVADDKDGILEPGELIRIKNLKVKSSGGMPLPANTAVRLYLTNSEFSVAEPIDVQFAEALAPGATKTLAAGELQFRIKNNILSKPGEERAKWNDTIRPLADLTEVNRPFVNYNNERHIDITYPIEIEPIQTLRTLSPGEASRFFFRVKNISQRDYGSEAELKRAIQMSVKRTGGDLAKNGLSFYSADGKPLDLQQGILKAVSTLKAGESALLEGVVAMDVNAESARAAVLEHKSDLERIEARGQMQTVQNRTVEIRVGQAYTHTPGADLLLVTNTKTDRNAIAAWKKMAADYGLKADVWDLNYNAGLDITRAMQNGSTLMDDFKGKTMVFLDNDFSFLNDTSRATQFLTRRQFLDAAAERGINFLIPGPSKRVNLLRGFLLPAEGTKASDYKSVREHMKAVRVDQTPASATGQIADVFSSIQVNHWTLFGKPKENGITSLNQRLQDRMRRLFPDRNYIVVQNFEPSLLRKGFLGVGRKWSVGTLEVRRSLDSSMGSGVTIDVDEAALTRGQFDKEMDFALLMTLSFEQKMQILERLHDSNETEKLAMIGDAIVTDLSYEQTSVRNALKGGWVKAARAEAAMPKLRRFAEFKAKVTGPAAETVASIASSIRFFSKAQKTIWDYLVPFLPNRTVDAVNAKLSKTAVRSAFANPRDAVALIKAKTTELRGSLSVQKKLFPKESKAVLAAALTMPARRAEVGAKSLAQAKLVEPEKRGQRSVVPNPTLDGVGLAARNRELEAQRAQYLVADPTKPGALSCEGLFK